MLKIKYKFAHRLTSNYIKTKICNLIEQACKKKIFQQKITSQENL